MPRLREQLQWGRGAALLLRVKQGVQELQLQSFIAISFSGYFGLARQIIALAFVRMQLSTRLRGGLR